MLLIDFNLRNKKTTTKTIKHLKKINKLERNRRKWYKKEGFQMWTNPFKIYFSLKSNTKRFAQINFNLKQYFYALSCIVPSTEDEKLSPPIRSA